jgi:hypothetical protein
MPTVEQTCPKCGMPRAQWRENLGQGYQGGGETYCCRGCADDTGCTCAGAKTETTVNPEIGPAQ